MKLFNKKQSDIPRRRIGNDAVKSQESSSAIFKRNRTLTGSRSNNLNATSSIKSDFESPRVHVHHLTKQRRVVFGGLLIALLSAMLLYLILSNFTAQAEVGVSNAAISKKINNSLYEQAIQDYLDLNPISRFDFALEQSALTTYVESRLPEVSLVEQKGSVGLGKTRFVISLRQPVAGWQINDKQYYVDAKGISFERNYFSTPGVQIVDSSGASVDSGKAVASKRFLGFVGRVVSLSKASGYAVTQAILPVDTTRQLEIKLKEVSYSIKLSIDRPAGEQVEDMSNAIKYFANHNKTPSYIDVRVSGKAFYK